MMLSDRSLTYSRAKSFNSSDMRYRSDFSSSNANYRKFGRMNASPSLDRLNAFDRSGNGFMSRQKSLHDLSFNMEMMSSLPSPINHRNQSLQKIRNTAWRQSESSHAFNKISIPRSRHALNGHVVSFNEGFMKPASHSPTPPRYVESSPIRDLLLNASSASPTLNRRNLHHLPNRSKPVMKHNWHISSSTISGSGDHFRPRLRERPLLSKITPVILSRPKSPLISSGTPSSSSTPTKFDETLTPERRDSLSGIYRNRHIIKFREHNIGQTPSQRRSSITWDLPTTYTNVKTPEELPISEQSDLNQEVERVESVEVVVSQKSNFESKLNEVIVTELLNKIFNLREIQKEIKNQEMKEKLILDKEIIGKTVSDKREQECNASHKVSDMVPIQTVADIPEPTGTAKDISLVQENASLKSSLKSKDRKAVKAVKDNKMKSPKKKKVKKKDILKDQVNAELKQEINANTDIESVVPKVETQICKDENENIIKDVDLNLNKIIDSTPKRIKFRRYTFDDFNLLKVLGRGSFGKVFIAELKDHGVYFAIKCLKKHSVIEDDDVESIMIERKVLAYGSNNPFICKLFCTFQTQSYLCFAMEWCCGGDLMFHVQKSGKFEEDKARFYASEILCAVQFMHKKGIIYRDLKLDNIMVDKEGHLRLVDFGMCQGRIYREDLLPSNFCGTPEYMAPEIIKGVQYNQSVDFWSFGVVLYEMVVGTSPFHGTDEDELLWNVCYEEVNYPRYLSENIKNILVWLLKKAPEERLGMPTCPVGDIMTQPFLISVEWEKVAKCQIKPPFIPELSSPFDVSYFDEYFTKEEPNLTPVGEEIIESMDQKVFKGFSYTNHRMTD